MSDAPIQVRRRRRSHFAQVPHGLARDGTLSDKALRLWVILQTYADWSDSTCYPTIETLAEHMGCGRRSVERAQSELMRRTLLEISSGQAAGVPNVYTVLDPDLEGTSPVTQGGTSPVTQGGTSPTTYKEEREPGQLDLGNESVVETPPPSDGFAEFWETYPRRNGKRVGRDRCEVLWRRLDRVDRERATVGARNLAESIEAGTWPAAKDPERFLRDRSWQDWQEPAAHDADRRGTGRTAGASAVLDEMGYGR